MAHSRITFTTLERCGPGQSPVDNHIAMGRHDVAERIVCGGGDGAVITTCTSTGVYYYKPVIIAGVKRNRTLCTMIVQIARSLSSGP